MKKLAICLFSLIIFTFCTSFAAQSPALARYELDLSRGTHDGTRQTSDGIALQTGESLGVYTSEVIESPDFCALALSWSAPQTSSAELWVSARVHIPYVGWSGWLIWEQNEQALPVWGCYADKLQVRVRIYYPQSPVYSTDFYSVCAQIY